MKEPINYGSLTPCEEPCLIDGKLYLLREAGEGTHVEYQNLASSGTKFNVDTNKVEIGNQLGRLESFLVSECLWEMNQEGQVLRQVPEKTIKQWPARIVRQLFDRAKEISGIDEKESPERKAIIAALIVQGDGEIKHLNLFRSHVQNLMETDPKLYRPLWKLIEPRESEETKVKNS